MDEVRTEQTKDLLNSMDDFLANLHFDSNGFYESYKLSQIVSKIRRARKEFDANLFFVLVVGPTKSGKSTLVNLLARRYVSPTHFLECTIRPSIITKHEELGIDQYFEYEHDRKEEIFEKVIDYLRGMIDENEIRRLVRKDAYSLNPTNIDTLIKSEFEETEDPLITVLKVEGGELVNGEIALIDMPGLDGKNANLENNPIYNLISKRADFIIFVQSSNAAISNSSEKFTKGIIDKSNKPPVWLIQNIFEANWWKTEEEKNEQIKEQIKVAKDYLASFDLKDVRHSAINLGKVNDATLADSGKYTDHIENLTREVEAFNEFEAQLLDFLTQEKVIIQEKNSVRNVYGKISEGIEEINILKEGLEAIVTKSELNDLIREVLENRSDYMTQLVKDSAVLVFVSTAVLQNGKLDAMASLIFNLRLIKRLVYATGFRPSYVQLINLYKNVLLAALVAATVEDLVEELDVFASALPIGDKLLGFIARSAADGVANALTTLRVGFITKEYLLKTPARFNAIEARKVARKQALLQIPGVCTEGLKNIGKNYVKVMEGVF